MSGKFSSASYFSKNTWKLQKRSCFRRKTLDLLINTTLLLFNCHLVPEFYYLLAIFTDFYTTFTNFHYLPTTFSKLYHFIPTFILLLRTSPLFTSFLQLLSPSPNFYTTCRNYLRHFTNFHYFPPTFTNILLLLTNSLATSH